MDLALFVACAPGLERLLADEVQAIAGAAEAVAGGVEARGDRGTLARCLVELGLASHVLVRVASFRARSLEELEARVGRLGWSGFLTRGVPRQVRATASKSRVRHTGAIEERVARAIATRLGDAPADAEDAVPIAARFVEDRCTISVDASGEPLHRRGYRLDPYRAPLREDLARGLVIASGWDRESPFVDPMCGSGTIAIEAALLATGRAPGAARAFAAERTPLDGGAIAAARAAAAARVRPPRARLLARDRDPRAIAAARANAARAGVEDVVDFELGPLSTTLSEPGAAIVTNPPWGERLGDREKLKALYRALGRLRHALGPAAKLAIAAHDRRLAYSTGVELGSAFLTRLGGLELNAMVERPR